jgi:hypothetical protein
MNGEAKLSAQGQTASRHDRRLQPAEPVSSKTRSNRVTGLVLLTILPVMVIAFGLIAVSGSGGSYTKAVTAASPDNLIAIATLGNTWVQAMGLFTAMIVIMTIGLGLLTLSLYRAGSRMLAPSALILFGFSATFFLLWLAFESTVTVWAAQETVRQTIAPALYDPLSRWNEGMFQTFMLLAYLAIAAFGGAMLRTRAIATWVAWFSIGLGCAGALARASDLAAFGLSGWLPVGLPSWILAGVPGWIPLWGAIIGAGLLATRQRVA